MTVLPFSPGTGSPQDNLTNKQVVDYGETGWRVCKMRLWENYRWLIPDKEVPVGSANYAFMPSATFTALLLIIPATTTNNGNYTNRLHWKMMFTFFFFKELIIFILLFLLRFRLIVVSTGPFNPSEM